VGLWARNRGQTLEKDDKKAREGKELEVPSRAGGSFLHLDDLAKGFEFSFLNQKAFGQIFNLSSQFLTWEDIANIIIEEVGSGKVKIISPEDWKGSSFLTNEWNLSSQKAENLLGFRPKIRESDHRILFKEIIKSGLDRLRLV
jgi:nucleoside-diphosphate-sugar epimerase